MDCVSLWIEDDDAIPERVQRKIVRDSSNVMDINDKSFVKNFRLSKDAFMYVLTSIEGELKAAQRSTAITPILKLAATLKFLAQGGYQHQIGQDRHLGISQQSMSSCLSEVCHAIEKVLCPKHIVLKSSEEKEKEARRYFYNVSGIPGVIGAVDGTHIQIIRPNVNEHLYFNRKLKHSINAMVICDHEMFIKAVNGRFGGASHDSHIWNLSSERDYLKELFENGNRSTRILGDSGYPLEPWILTPYRNAAEDSAESYFNEQHSKARSIVERTFGLMKARFRCLLAARELHYSPEKAAQILNVCCALHNICLKYRVEQFPIENVEADGLFSISNLSAETANNNFTDIAKNIRDEIKTNLRRN